VIYRTAALLKPLNARIAVFMEQRAAAWYVPSFVGHFCALGGEKMTYKE